MKIKIAILENDTGYLSRFVNSFEIRYADKVELYSFTELDFALQTLNNINIDIFISSNIFDFDLSCIPKRCEFAYFVDSVDIEMFNGQRAICKFQKIDLIYKQILSIYSENAVNIAGVKSGNEKCQVLLFTSPSGGVGSSTMAAACALNLASKGKKTLYLNLEKYGSADAYFSAEGQFNMSDVIFSLKSRKSNLSMKLESCVKQDLRGVYFYSQTRLALDMLELSVDEILQLVSEFKSMGMYDYIILDMDFSMDNQYLDIFNKVHSIIMVGDGSEISNLKIFRVYESLKKKELSLDLSMVNRTVVLYNKFSNKNSKVLENIEIRNIGGAPKYEFATTEQLLCQLSSLSVFNSLFEE